MVLALPSAFSSFIRHYYLLKLRLIASDVKASGVPEWQLDAGDVLSVVGRVSAIRRRRVDLTHINANG